MNSENLNARHACGKPGLKAFAAALTITASALMIPSIASAHDDLPPGVSTSVSYSPEGGTRADGHAPIGVMGEHMHKKGEWMLSYRFMRMHMEGMRSGTDSVSPNEVATTANPLGGEKMRMGNLPSGAPRIMTVPGTYRISPLEMDMDMHMFGLMYAPTDNITLMAMINYIENDMKLRTFRGGAGTVVNGEFTGETSGLGDLKLGALIRLYDDPIHHFHANLGLSLPTGSITKRGKVLPPFAGIMVPAGTLVDIDRLAYPMQLGSGSFDALPGITYTARAGDVSWGAQAMGTIRLHENRENYRLGDIIEGSAWAAYQWAPWISTSLRVSGKSEGEIRSRDPKITGGNPLSFAGNSGRDEVDLHVGVNLAGQTGDLAGHRFAIEYGVPVYQDVNGLQMENDWSLTLGWQKAF